MFWAFQLKQLRFQLSAAQTQFDAGLAKGWIPTHFRRNLSVIPPAGGKSRCISHVFHPGGKKKAEKRLDIGTKHDQTMFKMSNPATSSSIIQHHPAPLLT